MLWHILQLSNSSGWKLYNADYDGISLNFKYPAGYTYYDKDFSTAISFYNGGLFDLEVQTFELSRIYQRTEYNSEDISGWLKENVLVNYQDYISSIDVISLPNRKVYKFTIASEKYGFVEDRYMIVEDGVILNFKKFDQISLQDFFTIINDLKILS